MLSYRSMSLFELEKKLKTKGFSSETIGETVKRLQELKLLNDEEYAGAVASNLAKFRGYGRHKIASRLLEKGIDKSLANRAIEKVYEETGEAEFASRLVLKKIKERAGLVDKARIGRYLQSKGYSWEVISEVLRETDDRERDQK